MSTRLISGSLSVLFFQQTRAVRWSIGLSSRLTTGAVAFALLASNLLGQQSKPREYQIKAVYLFNFGRFVDWSASLAAAKSDSFAVCVIGQDPFGRTLDSTLAGELIDKRKVVAKRISRPQEATTCQVLFISSSEDGRLKDILPPLDELRVLTVSDIPHFSERGGMIQFVLEKDKIRFEVNLTNAERAGLKLSSELLKVAIAVKRNSQTGD
jgi:hypothetical protein